MYSAWFRNHQLRPNDQDGNWVAMFLIHGESPKAAQDWGDRLAKQFADRMRSEEFIRSCVEPPEVYRDCQGSVPRILQGEEASDEHIGW